MKPPRSFVAIDRRKVFLAGAILLVMSLFSLEAQAQSAGSLDSTFQANLKASDGGSMSPMGIAIQPDGKILVCNSSPFTALKADGSRTVPTYVARLNSNGKADETFPVGTSISGALNKIGLQSTGKIIIVGAIQINGGALRSVIRLNSNGSVDSTFAQYFGGSVEQFVIGPDDSIYSPNTWIDYSINASSAITRLSPNGIRDDAFQQPRVNGVGVDRFDVNAVSVTSDGTVWATTRGRQEAIPPSSLSRLYRISSPSGNASYIEFNLGGKFIGVGSLISHPEGGILAPVTTQEKIIRVLPSMVIDPGFNAQNLQASPGSIALQKDGKLIVYGTGFPRSLFRLNQNGSLDSTFNANFDNFNGPIAVQSDRKIVFANFYGNGIQRVLSPNSSTPGLFRPSDGTAYLRNSNTTGPADIQFAYGTANDLPVVGDWNGDGVDTLGIFRNGVFYLRNSNSTGPADIAVAFGTTGDLPIAGDWDGDGIDTIGIVRGNTVFLSNSNSSGIVDISFAYGTPTDQIFAGDWNGDGIDTIGAFRPSNGFVFLRNTNSTGFADLEFFYGIAGDKPIAGDWNGDGIDTIGIVRGNEWFLRNTNTTGPADINFVYGTQTDIPIVGDWNGLP